MHSHRHRAPLAHSTGEHNPDSVSQSSGNPALLKAEWIRPGRSTWQWINSSSLKFEEQHQWVDWTKSLGYEYYHYRGSLAMISDWLLLR